MAPPKFQICYVCSRQFGSKSIHIHEPKCLEKWHAANEQLPKHLQETAPKKQPHGGEPPEAARRRAQWGDYTEQKLASCTKCLNSFGHKTLKAHQKSCQGIERPPTRTVNRRMNDAEKRPKTVSIKRRISKKEDDAMFARPTITPANTYASVEAFRRGKIGLLRSRGKVKSKITKGSIKDGSKSLTCDSEVIYDLQSFHISGSNLKDLPGEQINKPDLNMKSFQFPFVAKKTGGGRVTENSNKSITSRQRAISNMKSLPEFSPSSILKSRSRPHIASLKNRVLLTPEMRIWFTEEE